MYSTYPYDVPKKRIELRLDPEVIKQLKHDAIKKYKNLKSISQFIEDLVKANAQKPDIKALKADREKFIADEIERYRNMPANARLCGVGRTIKCNICEGEFNTISGEANFCPACSSPDVRFMNENEDTVYKRIKREMDHSELTR